MFCCMNFVQPFRPAQFRTLGPLAHSQVEHDRVVVAIQRGERERAATAMRSHIATVREASEAYAAGTLAAAR
jgi:DNA-binding FadR family transcriptional regulator